MSTPNTPQPKPVPSDPQLVEFVVSELKRGAAPSDITYELCRRADVQWPEAEAFVRPFARQRQKPKPIVGLAVFLSLVALVVGIGVGVVKISSDRKTVVPIIYEAVTPTDSLVTGRAGDPYKLYRQRWIED